MRNVLVVQAILILISVAALHLHYGESALLPAFYGGAVALTNTMMLSRRVAQAGEVAKDSPQQGVYVIALGAVQRFVFVLVALGLGLQFMRLDPIPLLVTFALAQLTYLLAAQKQ